MIPLKLRRKHLRAPLYTNVIYKGGDGVQKAIMENISEGGALISQVSSVPAEKNFDIFLDIPDLPNFSNLPIADVLSLGAENFRHHIFHAELEVRREFNRGETEICLGCEFLKIDEEANKLIKTYVSNYASNIVFTLSLFEQGVHRQEIKNLIEKTVHLLNYPKVEKMSELRQKLLHDYQSLESL